jgi:hypothetical protein
MAARKEDGERTREEIVLVSGPVPFHLPSASAIIVSASSSRGRWRSSPLAAGSFGYCSASRPTTNGPSFEPAFAISRLRTYAATMPAKRAHGRSSWKG